MPLCERRRRQDMSESLIIHGYAPADSFDAVAEAAIREHLWTEREYQDIQLQLWQLMASQTRRYTMGDSSSVPVEVAEEIKKGILFCIGVCLQSAETPAAKAELLKKERLSTLFSKGQKEVAALMAEGRILLQRAKETALSIGNISYEDTLRSLPEFFRKYDRSVMAHEIPCAIDYQLCQVVPDALLGVEYINEYLRRLITENEFCLKFAAGDIIRILQSDCGDYRQDLINIFGPVFNNAVGLTLLGKDIFALDITEDDRQALSNLLADKNRKELWLQANGALSAIRQQLDIQEKDMPYFQSAAAALANRINSAKASGFAYVFLSFYEKQAPVHRRIYTDGPRMDDKNLRTVIEAIRESEALSEKIALVKTHLRSIRDLTEVLGVCFWGDDLIQLYASFTENERMILLDTAVRLYGSDDGAVTASAPEWCVQLMRYMGSTDHGAVINRPI